MSLTVADYEKYNFFRRPEWRWERILKLVERLPTPGRCSRFDDEFVKKARAFLLKYLDPNLDEEKRKFLLFPECPGMYYAYEFYRRFDDENEAALMLEARLLADESNEKIAEATGLHPEAVEWYEKIFFNVRDRLKNRDWITKQVLLPAVFRHYMVDKVHIDPTTGQPMKAPPVAKPFLDSTLKMFAYFGGPYVLDAMISGFQMGKKLQSPDDFAQWLDGHWMTSLRRRSTQASMTFKVTDYSAPELFMIHAKIIEIERSEDSADQARTAAEKQVKALMDEIPWSVGSAGEEAYRQRAIGPYDEGGVELRDDELLRVNFGDQPNLDEFPKKLPEGRKKVTTFIASKTVEEL